MLFTSFHYQRGAVLGHVHYADMQPSEIAGKARSYAFEIYLGDHSI